MSSKETELCPVCKERQKPLTWKFCSKCRSEHARKAKLAKQQKAIESSKETTDKAVAEAFSKEAKIGATTPDGKFYL